MYEIITVMNMVRKMVMPTSLSRVNRRRTLYTAVIGFRKQRYFQAF